MHNFINSVLTIILIGIAFICGPVLNYQTSQVSLARQQIVNETDTFLNGLSDKAYVTGQDLNKFYLDINKYGLKMNATIQVSLQAPSTDLEGKPISLNIVKYNDFDLMDNTDKRIFNKGDIIEIDLKEIGTSSWRKILYNLLRLDPGGFKYHMSDIVQ